MKERMQIVQTNICFFLQLGGLPSPLLGNPGGPSTYSQVVQVLGWGWERSRVGAHVLCAVLCYGTECSVVWRCVVRCGEVLQGIVW